MRAAMGVAMPQLSFDSVQTVTEGWDHVVYIVDDAYVFRFSLNDEYVRLTQLENDVLNYFGQRLTATIPQYSLVAHDSSFVAYEIVKGDILKVSKCESLTHAERTRLLKQLGEFITVLHTADITQSPLNRVPTSYLKDDQRDVRKCVEQHLSSALSLPELKHVERILADVDALLAQDVPRVFIHNDLYSRHLYWNSDAQQLGVIDFSDMCLGDPAVDFAELFEFGCDFVGDLLGVYGPAVDANFVQRAWTYQQWVGVYMMTDHFLVGKTTWSQARETFDRVLEQGDDANSFISEYANNSQSPPRHNNN